jgi:hypothetical protein
VGGVPGRQLAYQDEVGVRRLELTPGAIQLDRVRLAIDSAVVAQPDEGRRAVAPEVGQADLLAFLVGEDGVCEGIDCVRLVSALATRGSRHHRAQ